MAQRNDLRSEELRERSSEEIRQDIFDRRESLANTIGQLGSRMQEKLDWRKKLSQHPYSAMAAAAGLGFLLAGIFKPSPTPGKRMIRGYFQGLFQKIRPDMIMMLSTIILQAGGNFLLTKIKNASDHKQYGNEIHNEEAKNGKKRWLEHRNK
jgi:hypothetical protein